MKTKIDEQHKRHLQVIKLYELGLNIKGIAQVLGIHKHTVYWHVRREKARQERLADRGGQDDAGHYPTLGSLSHHRGGSVDHDPTGNPEQELTS